MIQNDTPEQNEPNPSPEPSGPQDPSQQSPDQPNQSCACPIQWWRWPLIVIIVALVIVTIRKHTADNGEATNPQDSDVTVIDGKSTIQWGSDFQAALAAGKEQNKPILLVFDQDGCPACEFMKKSVYPNKKVGQAIAAFVPVMVNINNETQLANQYGAPGTPTYVILGPDGSKIDVIVGGNEPAEFIAILNKALQAAKVGAPDAPAK